MFYNVLTTSTNNTHIKRKNSKTICSSKTISFRIFGSAPNSPTLGVIYTIQWAFTIHGQWGRDPPGKKWIINLILLLKLILKSIIIR
jgi:hypothetical protein